MPIKIENLTHIYMQGTPFEATALQNINLEIDDGEFVGLIGHTGSGKSTLIQHLNGLLKPTSGTITVNDIRIDKDSRNLKEVRRQVGLVFQYPEHQLFEETVYQDIAFGPRNLGLSAEEIDVRVKEAMALVGLDFDSLKDRSPFELSGGQRRRVAIAGVIAMKPKILILDEPTAGLDPRGRDEILGQIKEFHERYGITVILVSHSMEDVARLVNKIIVMNRGRVALYGTPEEVFRHADELEEMGLGIPQITRLMRMLRERGIDVPDDVFTIERAKEVILQKLKGGKVNA
ncbi:MAG: energy-coupling factor transporter ATPase [Tissierellales bacterium]